MVWAVLGQAEEPTGKVSFLRSEWRKNERGSEEGETNGSGAAGGRKGVQLQKG